MNNETKNRLIIIDGNAIVHRAYHALPPMNTRDGKMVNAVYGFTSMLLKVWHDLKPTHIAVSFDMAGGTFRHEKYTEYKATRVKADQELYDQIPLCHDLVRAFNIPIYEKKGYEADDVIGTIVKKNKNNKDLEIIIVTGDKDTLQLVGDGVKVMSLRKGMSDTVMYDEKMVKEVFGFSPIQMIDYKALAGDSSDNIPGVSGIGEKTAVDLITKFGSVEELYKQLTKNKEQLTKKLKPGVIKKLIDGKDSALMSYDLATIDQSVPDLDFKLADCVAKEFDRDRVILLFKELEFTSFIRRLPNNDGVFVDSQETAAKTKKTKSKETKAEQFKFVETTDLKIITDKILSAQKFAAKFITSGPNVYESKIEGLALVVGNEGFWLPAAVVLNNSGSLIVARLQSPSAQDDGGQVVDDIVAFFQNEKLELIGHDLKQFVKVLAVHCGINICHPERSEGSKLVKIGVDSSVLPQNGNIIKNKIFDTMLASYLLEPGSRAHSVESVILKNLGKELPKGVLQNNLFGIDGCAVAEELWLVAQCEEKLKSELIKTNDLGLLQKLEIPLLLVLAEIELNGVAVDKDMLIKMESEVAKEIKKLTDKIYGLAGQEFNISSPIQLREILFDKLQIPTAGVKKGKTGYSTDAEELEKIYALHPIVPEIQNYRELAKLKNTYIDVLPTLINKITGRIHTTFNQAVTATGRLSSSEPNLQNIPIRTALGREVRKAFVAEDGNVLISADYSQIELRIVASLAQDKRMMEIFDKDEDIHRATAAAINGVKLEDVTKEMRRAAKEVNFGILYGMGAYGLAWRAEIPQWQAKEFINKYFEQFSGVKKYLDETLEFTRKEGYCETLFGRRRYIPELNSGNYQLRSAAERMAINHPVQGTAADLIKMAMIEVDKKIKDGNCKVKMILQVHDELVFEVKKELAEEVAKVVKDTMESVVKLRVPIKVETNIGHSWGEMK